MDISPFLDQIRAWNPSLDIYTARVDPYGLNNLVIIINDEWVYRFPRNDEARSDLLKESALLAVIRRYVKTAVPDFAFNAGREFVAYRLLAGKPLYRHALLRWGEAAQERLAADLAGFLSDLHNIPETPLVEAGMTPAPMPSDSRSVWRERLEAIRAELYPNLWAEQHAYIEDLFAPVLEGWVDMEDFNPTLIHNDLAAYHLLGDSTTGRLGGVLDFGEAGWGDPAADFGILINVYGESLVSRMERFNPAISGLLERARFRAAYVELEWALKGARTNNPQWLLVHIGRARDSKPMARPAL